MRKERSGVSECTTTRACHHTREMVEDCSSSLLATDNDDDDNAWSDGYSNPPIPENTRQQSRTYHDSHT